MSINKIEIQDGSGNVYYPKTSIDSVIYSDNASIEERIRILEYRLNELKSQLANSINNKTGSSLTSNSTVDEMTVVINSIKTLEQATADANATAGNILVDKTAYVNGAKITGTMPNKGAVTASLNCGGSYTIPAGYHNGSGKVAANSLASQTSANATAGDILKNKTAWVNGSKITGAMPNLSADTPIQHESNNSTKVIEADGAFIGNNTDGVQRIGFRYNGADGYITRNTLFGYPMSALRNDLGITANKIVAGNTIGGIAGTATLESLGGARKFIQRITVNETKGQPDKHTINVGFKPRFVLCWVVTSNGWHSQDLQLYSTDINGLQSGAWIQGHGSSSSGYWPKCKITGLHDNGFYYGDGKNTISKDDTFQMDVIAIG